MINKGCEEAKYPYIVNTIVFYSVQGWNIEGKVLFLQRVISDNSVC